MIKQAIENGKEIKTRFACTGTYRLCNVGAYMIMDMISRSI